jgi:hypothetical protein
MDLLRKPIAKWPRSSLVWTTQFNDLRTPASVGSNYTERYRRVQLELKMLALLLPCAVIRDADIVNHIELLDLLQRDVDGFRSVFERGAITLGIRETASSLVDVNEKAAKNRAFPERYDKVRIQLPQIDRWLGEQQVVLVETSANVRVDRFAANLRTILNAHRLSGQEEEILEKAILASRQRNDPDSLLRFGDIYRYILDNGLTSSNSDLLQWCRAAHVLVAPAAHALPPSTVDQDLRPEMITLLYGRGEALALDPDRLLNLYPRRILSDDTLMRMDFPTIVRLRSKAIQLGYFQAAHAIQQPSEAAQFEKNYISYLRTLAEYLELIARELSVELVDWQKLLLERQVKIEEKEALALCWGVPFLVLTPIAIATVSWVPIQLAGLVGMGLTQLQSLRSTGAPSPLTKLLLGTTVTPYVPR